MIRNWIHNKWTTSNLIQLVSDENGNFLKKDPKSWNPLGRLPCWVSPLGNEVSSFSAPNIRKVNRYLSYQETRLKKLKSNKEYSKVVILWCILLKNSNSYQMALFHSTCPGWYWKKSQKEALKLLISCINKCRKWDITLTLKRFYLDKGMEKEGIPNGKLRPIGAPTTPSKVISKSINNLIYFLFEDKMKTFQNGYRQQKGTHTALWQVWKKIFIEKNKYIYEFDFKSFFSKVSPWGVHNFLGERSWELADLVIKIISQINYTFDRSFEALPKEAEIHKTGVEKKVRRKNAIIKPLVSRRGLPQGLSFSPILATLVLELPVAPEGLIMCADDGVIITRTEAKLEKDVWFRELKKYGVVIAPDKTSYVKNTFKFLGVDFDIEKETMKFRDSTFTWKGLDLSKADNLYEIQKWIKTVAQFYGKEPEKWNWKIKENAYCERAYIEPYNFFKGVVWESLSWIHFNSTFWESYRGYRYFKRKDNWKGGILHISRTSTQCCEWILNDLKDASLVKLRELKLANIPTKSNTSYHYINKKKYVEDDSWIYRLNWTRDIKSFSPKILKKYGMENKERW